MKLLHPYIALLACVIGSAPVVKAGGSSRNRVNATVSEIPTFDEVLNRPLSLADALNIAAAQNASIRAARDEVQARFGVAIQVRAIVFPKLIASGQYNIRQDSLIEQNQNRDIPGFTIPLPQLQITRIVTPTRRFFRATTDIVETEVGGGTRPRVNNQIWNVDVRLVQSIYEGGRLMSALRQDRLIREQAMLDFQTTLADQLLNVRIAYDDAQLAELQVRLHEQSVNLLGQLLGKISEQKKVGAVTEFEELRAKLEQNNARTPLATARQDLVIAKQNLVQLMGYDEPPTAPNSLPLDLITPLHSFQYDGSLPQALVTAEELRPELASIRVAAKLADEAILVAKAGTKPSVQAFAAYDAISRVQSRNAGDPLVGGLAGVQFQWPIFDGFLTRGKIVEAKGRRAQIEDNTDELKRQITLQVRSEWARMVEARNILNVQAGNVKIGVRALELANVRFGAGIGSQVEVLSAQTALTDARSFYADALRNYSVAYSRFLRATGEDMQRPQAPKMR